MTRVEYSRRFLRELDEAPGRNNLQYIYYSVLAFLLKTKYYIVIFDQLQGHSRGLIQAPESCVRGPLTFTPPPKSCVLC